MEAIALCGLTKLYARSGLLILLVSLPGMAFGHDVEQPEAVAAIWQWAFEPWVIFCLALSLGLYAAGITRLWRKATNTHHQLFKQAGWFTAGWLTLIVALVSPLDALGSQLFSAHMLQHELLMIVAAPFFVLSRPFSIWIWALPLSWRYAMANFTRTTLVSVPWNFLTTALVAWLAHALILWLWHVPAFFEAALSGNAVHTLQHLCFLISALFFWWAVLGDSAQAKPGASMIYLFTTMIHTGALGALLTFSAAPWYPSYHGLVLGLTALEDQQLGGLIMWVPGGLAYVIAGLALGACWLGHGTRSRTRLGNSRI